MGRADPRAFQRGAPCRGARLGHLTSTPRVGRSDENYRRATFSNLNYAPYIDLYLHISCAPLLRGLCLFPRSLVVHLRNTQCSSLGNREQSPCRSRARTLGGKARGLVHTHTGTLRVLRIACAASRAHGSCDTGARGEGQAMPTVTFLCSGARFCERARQIFCGARDGNAVLRARRPRAPAPARCMSRGTGRGAHLGISPPKFSMMVNFLARLGFTVYWSFI